MRFAVRSRCPDLAAQPKSGCRLVLAQVMNFHSRQQSTQRRRVS
jgi:hypothetical protein